METSDSEYFESADEEFNSDEEDLSTATKKSVSAIENSVKNISLSNDKISKNEKVDDAKVKAVDTKTEDISSIISKYTSKETVKTENIKDKNNVIEESTTSDDSKISPLKLDEDEKNKVKNINDNVTLQEVDSSTKVENIDLGKDVSWGEGDWENKEALIDDNKHAKENVENEKQVKPEADKDEENMWEDIDDWEEPVQTKKSKNKCAKPPTMVECWEPGVDYEEPLDSDESSDKMNRMTECWEPGVDYPADSEENMWDDDEDWEPITDTQQNKNDHTKPADTLDNLTNSGWGSWGSWGLSSVLSTATASVSTLTSHVSQGITTVLESGIGVPDPEELAKEHKEEQEKLKEVKDQEDVDNNKSGSNLTLGLGFGNLVSGVSQITKLVEKTSTKVISGGLDTLETIGKKTMEVLQENDPGLKKKRAFLKIDSDKPILSQVLREAKEKAEQENRQSEQANILKRSNYEAIFDDHQGLVHLEALEMLSKQCDIKLQSLSESLSGNALTEMQETMDQVKELCELPDEEDEEVLEILEVREKLQSIVTEINVPIKYNGLLTTWEEVEDWLNKVDVNICNEHEMHKQAINSLAHLTAIAVEQYHKIGELLLVKEHRSTADEADSLVQLTTTLTTLISNVARQFSEKLNQISIHANNKEGVNELITNVFFEAGNSSRYVQDAFQLLIPVLQVGAV